MHSTLLPMGWLQADGTEATQQQSPPGERTVQNEVDDKKQSTGMKLRKRHVGMLLACWFVTAGWASKGCGKNNALGCRT